MKKSEFVNRVLEGEPLVAVEYRSSKAEKIQWRDKETRSLMHAVTLAHTVENKSGSIRVADRAPDDLDPEKYVPPFKKGDAVILHLTGLQVQRGVITAQGTMERLEDDGAVTAGSVATRAQVPATSK